MQPWKMFVRSVSVVTVLTAGGFAAGQNVLPFANASRHASPQVSVDDTAPDTETPAVDPAAVVDETDSATTTTTTTTETPAEDTPSADPVSDPAPAPKPTTTTTTVEPVEVNIAPSAPAADPAPEKVKGDHNCDGHADNGWHDKSDEWQQAHADHGGCGQNGPAADPSAAAGPDAKAKGDHNCDGHLDNGWHNKERPVCPTPDPNAPPAKNRPADAPGHLKHGQ